jgi:Single-strand binding protein family
MTMNSIPFTAAGNLTDDPESGSPAPGSGRVRAAGGNPAPLQPRRGRLCVRDHDIRGTQVWGEQAEYLVESLHREDQVLVVGRWATRVFTPQQGPNEGRQLRRTGVVGDEIGRVAVASTIEAADMTFSSGVVPGGS